MGKRPSSGERRDIFTIDYYGKGNRFILSEEVYASSYEGATIKAERAMPAGAVTFKVIDRSDEARLLSGDFGPDLTSTIDTILLGHSLGSAEYGDEL